jgi:uncharacterized protein YcfJ
MRRTAIVIALSVMAVAPVMASASGAEAASCSSRKTTGTIVGGVGGALVGHAIGGGTGGTIIGGLGGGLLGRQVGKSGCKRVVYRSAQNTRYAPSQSQAVRKVYYDQHGNVVGSAPVR